MNHTKETPVTGNTFQRHLRIRKQARIKSRIQRQREIRQAVKRITSRRFHVLNLAFSLEKRQRDFVEGIMDAMHRGDAGYIIRLADLYRDISELSEIRETLNKISLRMIAANASEVQQ